MSLLVMPSRTYTAKLFEVPWESASFKVAGTLDGFVDLATPNGTYPLSLDEARSLAAALTAAVADVEANCLYGRDTRLQQTEER